MIEIALGVLIIAAVLAVVAGIGGLVPGVPAIDLFPLLGIGGTGVLLAAGALLVAAGMTRRAIARDPARRFALRTARLTASALLAIAGLAVALPLTAGPFNLVRIGGFPLGYYLAAQGGLIALVILAFVWAACRNRIEAEEGGHE